MHTKISIPKAPSLPAMPTGVPAHLSIVWEQFPRIGEKISLMWGYAELQMYLGEIIFNKRDYRNGFPEDILAALLELHSLNAKLVTKN